MDRDDDRAGAAERERVLGVDERGLQPAKRLRQRPRHPQLLRAGREEDGEHAGWNEIRSAGHGGDLEARGSRGLRQRAQEIPDVGLVARSLPPEDVGVDDDERHASSRQRSTTRSAERRQVNIDARARPASASASRRRVASSIPAAIAPGRAGRPARPRRPLPLRLRRPGS